MAETSGSAASDVFVGRSPELAALAAALESAAAGHPRIVVVSGEPGIGKSRLLDEFALDVAAKGIAVHWGRCREAGGAPPYWPWVQVLRTIVRQLDDEGLRAALGAGAAEVAQVVPEVGDRLSGLPPSPELDPESARFRLFDALTRFIAADAATVPQIVLLDDVHAADEPSLLFLEFLAAEIRDCRLLLVVTTRSTELVRVPRLATLLRDIERVPIVRRLPLSGFAPGEIDRYLELFLGSAPSPDLVTRAAERSDGNPLYLGEIVRLLLTEGTATGVLPHDVRDTVLRRAAHVSDLCNDVLRTAAVIGREVDVEVLSLVAERSDDEIAEALDEADAALLLTSVPGSPGRVRFAHALVRDALYGDLPARRRAMLHRRVGEALEKLHGDRADAVLAELALHFFEAAPVGDPERAVDCARRAGEQALRLLAFEEAERLFELALQAVEITRETSPAVRCDLWLSIGEARLRGGDLESAQQAFLEAARLARTNGLGEHLARAAIGYGSWYVWSALRGDPHFLPLLDDALAAIGPDDNPLRVQLLARYGGGALRDSVDRGVATAMCEEAVAMARRLGDRSTLAYALDGHLGGVFWPENAEERLGLGAELIALAGEIGAVDRAQSGHIYCCSSAMELADRRRAEIHLDMLRRTSRELRSPVTRWSALVMEINLLLMEGRLEEAEALVHEAFALRRAQATDSPTSYWLQLFMLRKEQGRIDEVREALVEHAAKYPTRPLYRCALAHLHAVTGRERDATWALEALAARDFEDLPRNDEWLFGMSLLAEVVELVDDRERAALVYELLQPYDQRVAVAALVVACGAVARPLGILASLLGRHDDADRHFETAVAVNQRLGAHLWVGRTEYDWARLLLSADRPGDRERARGLLDRARAVATTTGSVDLAQRIDTAGVPTLRTGALRRIRRVGEDWAIAFDGTDFHVHDTKGLGYLAVLLARPHESVHVLELTGRSGEHGGGDPVLDDRAKAAYRDRLQELDEEVAEAEAWGDDERAARARDQIEALARELSAALGRGTDRVLGSSAERARQSVTKALRTAIDRIARQSPALGRHLDATISTGTFCTYRPARDDPTWAR